MLVLGFNLASIFTFRNDDDRLYFVKQDVTHKELVAFVDGKLGKEILVLDFVDGKGESINAGSC